MFAPPRQMKLPPAMLADIAEDARVYREGLAANAQRIPAYMRNYMVENYRANLENVMMEQLHEDLENHAYERNQRELRFGV